MHSAILDVNLTALASNYRLLKQRHARQSVAAVVKADAYGLGMNAVAKQLWDEGCHDFFVATLSEGIALRNLLPDARIGVFNGLFAKEEKEYLHHRLLPVLNDAGQLEQWEKATPHSPAMLHIDTGMTRLGFNYTDLRHAALRHHSFVTNRLALVMSHLACAGETHHAKNAEQLARFHEALQLLPGIKTSLSNSSGLFLSRDFHFDLARPGCALYGINPTLGTNPMQPVATLSAPLLQIRTLDRDETIGYDATYAAKKGSRIAVVGLGYADGWLRALGNKGFAYIADYKVPIVGKISMDMLALDVTHVPEAHLAAGSRTEFINPTQTVDDIAAAANTIGYEIFTRIGSRVERRYIVK